jgi:hypothetical protein
LPVSEQAIVVTQRKEDDLPTEVKGLGVRWTENLGYQIQVPLEGQEQEKTYDVEFINNRWYLLTLTTEGYKTIISAKLNPYQWDTGLWPEDHSKNPKNLIIATAESFGDYLEGGLRQMSGTTTTPGPSAPPPAISKGKKKEQPKEEEETPTNSGRSFRGKAPETFDGDRTKSKAFISDMTIYMKVNQKHPDIKNPYTRIFIALSFIKGPNVVNWVEAQFHRAEENLDDIAGGDETDEDLWKDFIAQFKSAYISLMAKEEAYIKL